MALSANRREISASLTFETPPGRARAAQGGARAGFWRGASGTQLVQGGLVALVWQTNQETSIHLGTIASSVNELTAHVRNDGNRVKIRVVFFDSDLELRILSHLRTGRSSSSDIKVLVESPVMFESIRPFLEALKTVPENIPFSRYLVFHPPNYLRTCAIDPPKYGRLPGFSFDLSSLFNPEAEVDELRMSVSDQSSIDRAQAEMYRASRLDPSQADAVITALTRELVLIQGTTDATSLIQSYTGVELLRVLIANHVGPILMIAFTNHALDHMLCSVLDAGITTDFIRLGSRTSDERISQYSLKTREMAAEKSRLNSTLNTKYRQLRSVTKQVSQLLKQMREMDLESDSSEIVNHLGIFYPEHHAMMSKPPSWIGVSKIVSQHDHDSGEEWKVQGSKGQVFTEDTSIYAFWKNSGDLKFLDMITKPHVSHVSQSGTLPVDPGIPNSGHSLGPNRFEFLSTETAGDAEDTSTSDEYEDDESDEDAFDRTPPEKIWMTAEFASAPDSDTESETEKTPAPPIELLTSPIAEAISTYLAYVNDAEGFFAALGEDGVPEAPSDDRTLRALLDEGDVWNMSHRERQILHAHWIAEACANLQRNQQDEFDCLRKKHAEKVQEYNEIKEEVRRDLMKNADIIGCTTTGAAKFGTLLKSLSPKVVMVEEAGQVLEAHVLASLMPSVEHLILIGDPLQLRPILNNYSLSMDHPRGEMLYRFDMSLMERLAVSKFPMSRIDVQRRMRPTISSLIRNTLYEGLLDHDLVQSYPDVRGMVKNVFFVTHNHRENRGGADNTESKHNKYELLHFHENPYLLSTRQGCYSSEGDIVVLCAYLGQLVRLRDALGGEVTVVIDERDQVALDDCEAEQADAMTGGSIQHVSVTSRVRLRTIDNYQGEEGKVVILSLVRNSGGADDEMEIQTASPRARVNIGFLKSENRTNVALSRAREGLYIFGNAEDLSYKSSMWCSILEELDAQDALGPALPVACHRHRDKVEYVLRPGQLSEIAPNGGCLEQCDTLLKCGHLCPSKCHCDDPEHVTVICAEPCRRLCDRDHPCKKDCGVPCGNCTCPVPNVQLPCGHFKDFVPCYQLDMLGNVRCDEEVVKQLQNCGHSASMPCFQDPENYRCRVRCTGLMTCCGKTCNASCNDCQVVDTDTERTKHASHPCQKRLYCEHACQEPCSEGHEHTTQCGLKCRQVCLHAQCKRPCYVPCAPCEQPCMTCPHYTCPVPCGSVCARLPCDRRCEKPLQCGHRCPSVCGEDCAIQACPQCVSEGQKLQATEFVQCTLAEADTDLGSLDKLITIPSCRHVFTVETLDEHCGMTDFYSCGQDGRWLGLLTPDGFRQPPTCPTCRTEITAPRYRRVFKRAALDILERNLAVQMSQSLGRVQSIVESVTISSKKDQLVTAAAIINLKFRDKTDGRNNSAQVKARKRALFARELPTSDQEINFENAVFHSIDTSVRDVWRKAMHELLTAYRQAVQVAETRSAHTQSWEAALSCLYEHEVGQPRPLVDRRFLVEAIWMTLHIRLKLITLTSEWIDAIGKRTNNGIKSPQQLNWATYVGFLFSSCSRDADVAFDVANDSESHRQISKTAAYQMRISLEEFRFDMIMCKMTGSFKAQVHRDTLAARASTLRENAVTKLKTTIRDHQDKKRSAEEMVWLQTNFSSVAHDILEEWEKIERSIRMDTFYEPVSLEERITVAKAFDFGERMVTRLQMATHGN
ncbi:hypothetical protein JVU11DRAFT_10154 [Chiua virens]|nr:hypothetical protein JVU11DRAFT_10154 [Chiua virens]